MKKRSGTVVAAWSIAGASVALCAAGFWLTATNGTATAAVTVLLTLVVDSVVGALVVSRAARNSTGWVLLGIGLVGSLSWFLWDYGYTVLVLGPSWLPLGELAIWFAGSIWILAAGSGLASLLVRLPDGNVPSRWRWVDPVALAGGVAVMISLAVAPTLASAGLNRPSHFGVPALAGFVLWLRWAGYAVLAAAVLGAVAALVSRLVHARGDEREQLKWIGAAAALNAIALVYGLGRQVFGGEILFAAFTPFFIATAALPAAIGVAVLKYRLYDIDLVINRALVYGGLTAMLAGLYTFWVGLTQRLVTFSGQKSDLVILLTAFFGAAAFTPVKNWLQKTVDKRFAVHDPASQVDSMREQVQVVVNVLDAQRIARRLVDECASTYGARYAALSLTTGGNGLPFYAFGEESAAVVLRISMHSRGQEVGVLSLSERRRGLVYTQRDQSALQLYADTVAEAIDLWEVALRREPAAAAR